MIIVQTLPTVKYDICDADETFLKHTIVVCEETSCLLTHSVIVPIPTDTIPGELFQHFSHADRDVWISRCCITHTLPHQLPDYKLTQMGRRLGHSSPVTMPFSPEQLATAKELRASFAPTRPPRRHGNGGGRSGPSNTSHPSPNNGQNGHRSGPGPYTAAVRDGPCQHFTQTSRSGSLASSNDQRGSSYISARNAPQPPRASGFNSYGSSGTPRASQPAPTTTLNRVQPHRDGVQDCGNAHNETAAVATRSNVGAMRTHNHQPPSPSSPHVAGSSSKPHGGLGNDRYASATTEAPSIVSLPALPGNSSSASTVVTNGNDQTVQSEHSSVVAQGPKHGGLGSSRYANDTNDTSKAASAVLPVFNANGNGVAPVVPVVPVVPGTNGTNGLASQDSQASNDSQAPQDTGRFTLTAANGFGVVVGTLPHVGTGSNLPSHIRGISNTSDVEMIDLDGHTEEGIKPLRRHGGIGESRWAASDYVSDAKSPETPPTPNNRPVSKYPNHTNQAHADSEPVVLANRQPMVTGPFQKPDSYLCTRWWYCPTRQQQNANYPRTANPT